MQDMAPCFVFIIGYSEGRDFVLCFDCKVLADNRGGLDFRFTIHPCDKTLAFFLRSCRKSSNLFSLFNLFGINSLAIRCKCHRIDSFEFRVHGHIIVNDG